MVKTPRPRRKITNQEFEEALANSNNTNIIWSVTQGYLGVLSHDDLHACGLHALWRCLQYYRPDFGQKFTTSLHRFVHWECKRELRKINGSKTKRAVSIVSLYEEKIDVEQGKGRYQVISDDLNHVRDRMKLLSFAWQRKVLDQYYFQRMTMQEIGKANGYSKEAARQKVNKALTCLKNLCHKGSEI